MTPALFGLYASPGWKLYPHLRLIAEKLCQLAAGTITRLMVFTPPRHGKSQLCSKIFPAWYLGAFPDRQVIMTGYGDRFAQQWGRRARDLLLEHGKSVFGIEISEKSSAADVWEVKGRQGVMKSSGIGGQITGFGAHCVTGDTVIETSRGPVPIQQIYAHPRPCYVLSYWHGKAVYAPATCIRRIEGRRVRRVTDTAGHVLTLTPDHRVFSAGRWVAAESLAPGDSLLRAVPSEVARGEGFQAIESAVALVEDLCEEAVVYDLQVDGPENFFANGFLIHNCLLIDDPIKNREEADSEVFRESIWDWYNDVAETRLMKNASQLLIMTRWHEDDLAGRLLKDAAVGGPKWDVVRLPALAEEPEDWGFWKRATDEPLCPDLIPLAQLRELQRKEFRWASLYQQRPYPKGGGVFNVDRLRERRVNARPPDPKITVRGWDLAATEKKESKRTAGIRLSRTPDGRIYIEHGVCGKWLPDKRNAVMKATSDTERGIKILFEHEGGSSGEDQALAITRLLAGHRTEGVKVTGDKVARADPIAALINAGGVWIVDDGSWDVEGFLSELEAFPNGTYKDQVDALSLGGNHLLLKAGPGMGDALIPKDTGWRGDLQKLTTAPNENRPPTLDEMPDVPSAPEPDWRGDFDRMTGG